MKTPERKKKSRPPRTTPKKWADDRSNGSSTPSRASTPRSLLVGGPPLTRDLSDLSGSYLNGNTAPRGANPSQVPGSVYHSDQSATSYERPWRHAKILSSREPNHPQPHNDADSAGFIRKAMIVADQHGDIEIVRESDDMTINTMDEHHRFPMLILLMDPGRKIYELMQLWIDPSIDTVRDVLYAVQQNLSEKWRQDYDGLFSVRGKNFNQLIHILNLSKYELQPHEIWVAKPWSMSAQGTAGYASELLDHLKDFGILAPVLNPRWNFVRPRTEDVILALSKAAQARVYVPGGILKHHHASQFLTFVPPFEANVRVDVLGSDPADEGSASASTLSASDARSASTSAKRSTPASASTLSASDARSASTSAKRSTPSSSPARDSNVPFEAASTQKRRENQKGGCFRRRRVTDNKGGLDKPTEVIEPRGLIRVLSSLNCACSKGKRDDRSGGPRGRLDSDTMLDTSDFGGLWKVFEEEGSIISESAPLLNLSPFKSDWTAELQ